MNGRESLHSSQPEVEVGQYETRTGVKLTLNFEISIGNSRKFHSQKFRFSVKEILTWNYGL